MVQRLSFLLCFGGSSLSTFPVWLLCSVRYVPTRSEHHIRPWYHRSQNSLFQCTLVADILVAYESRRHRMLTPRRPRTPEREPCSLWGMREPADLLGPGHPLRGGPSRCHTLPCSIMDCVWPPNPGGTALSPKVIVLEVGTWEARKVGLWDGVRALPQEDSRVPFATLLHVMAHPEGGPLSAGKWLSQNGTHWHLTLDF